MGTAQPAKQQARQQTAPSSADGDGNTGNVKLTQGSVNISGDDAAITFNSDSNEAIYVLVNGNPAYFRWSNNLDPSESSGSSSSIEYDVRESNLIFSGNVTFSQPGITYECGRLLYNLESDLAEGTGGCRGAIIN